MKNGFTIAVLMTTTSVAFAQTTVEDLDLRTRGFEHRLANVEHSLERNPEKFQDGYNIATRTQKQLAETQDRMDALETRLSENAHANAMIHQSLEIRIHQLEMAPAKKEEHVEPLKKEVVAAASGEKAEEINFPAVFAVQNALAGLDSVFAEGDTTAISTTVGFHNVDSLAVALGVALKTRENLQLHMGLATDVSFETFGGNAGVTFSF